MEAWATALIATDNSNVDIPMGRVPACFAAITSGEVHIATQPIDSPVEMLIDSPVEMPFETAFHAEDWL